MHEYIYINTYMHICEYFLEFSKVYFLQQFEWNARTMAFPGHTDALASLNYNFLIYNHTV